MGILVVGTVALDSVQTPFGQVRDVLGGSAAYAAVSASFFTSARLVSIVGKDFPLRFIRFFKTKNIDTEGLQVQEGKTFRWSGSYDYDFNTARTLKTELNLLGRFNPVLPAKYQNEKFIFLANIDPHIQLDVLNQIKSPYLVVSDTMNYWIEHEKEPLRRVVKKSDILIINDAETREFSQQSNLIKAVDYFLSLGPQLVIVKRGEYGCLLFAQSFSFCLPAYLLENVRDPTGAGDTFAGGFLGYLATCPKINEAALKKALACATVMSSFAVEDFSLNRLRKLNKSQIRDRFKHLQRMTRF